LEGLRLLSYARGYGGTIRDLLPKRVVQYAAKDPSREKGGEGLSMQPYKPP